MRPIEKRQGSARATRVKPKVPRVLRFTDSLIERRTRSPEHRTGKLVSDAVQRGLYLRIGKTGTVSWVLVDQRNRKFRTRAFADWPRTSCNEARAKAAAMRLEDQGVGLTWGSAAERFLKTRAKEQVPHVQRNAERILLEHFGALNAKKLDSIRREEVAQIVSAKFVETPETAKKMLVYSKSLMRWALTMGNIERDPLALLDAEPLFGGYRSQPRERVLDDDEIRAVWNDGSPSGFVLWFQLLTGARVSEALQFGRSQIEERDEGDFWHVPAENTKSRREDRHIPLSAQALAISNGDARFPPKISYSGVIQWTRKRYTFTTHDCRRTFSTRLGELGAPPDLIDRLLGHARPKLRRIYHHHNWRPQGAEWVNVLGAKLEQIALSEPRRARGGR